MNLRAKILRGLVSLLAPRSRYEGARHSTSRSWIPGDVVSARFDATCATRLELVRKSRYFEKNSGIVNRLADIFEAYTVGSGLRVIPASSDPAWNDRALDYWNSWGRSPDISSRQPFPTFQSLMSRTWFIDGEVFVLLTRGPGEDGKIVPKVQMIEGHLVNTPPELRRMEGQGVIDGVQVDSVGRPVGYYIATEADRKKVYGAATRAEFVLHVGEPGRAGQYRPLPFLYPVINDLHDLDDLQVLEMKAAKDAAEITNVVKTQTGELNDEEFLRRLRDAANENKDGTLVTERRAEAVREAIGGRTVALMLNESLDQFSSSRPNVASREYWRYLTEKVCAGVGIPYVLVFPDSMQGTVYRGSLDVANAFFRARSSVIADATVRIFEYVIGAARFTDRRLADAPADWARVRIHAPRSVNVDVGRNSVAMLKELESGTRTFAGVYGEFGEDFRTELRQKAMEAKFCRDLADEFGITVAEISTILQDRAERIRTEPVEPEPATPDPNAAPAPEEEPALEEPTT